MGQLRAKWEGREEEDWGAKEKEWGSLYAVRPCDDLS